MPEIRWRSWQRKPRKAARKALDRIKVRYQVQEPLLDFTKAKDNPIVVHPEENFRTLCDVGTDASRNLCSTEQSEVGDVEAELAASEVVLHPYLSHQGQQPGDDGDLPHLLLPGRVRPA
ncbi:MAG: hypothetical protein V8Q30_10870 [Acutalibacteraceae bacterium]